MNINKLNYLSVKLVSPEIKLADISYNAEKIIEQINHHSNDCNLLVFPELCLTGATCGDRFFFDELTNQIDFELNRIVTATKKHNATLILGTPFKIENHLIDCAILISTGKIIGIIPKQQTNRWFSKYHNTSNIIKYNNSEIPISENIIFTAKYENSDLCKIGICVGEPTVTNIYNLKDADILVSIDAKPYIQNNNDLNEIVFLSKFSKQAILYVNSNANESTTDKVYSGLIGIAECGKLLNDNLNEKMQNTSLSFETSMVTVEIDIDLIHGFRKRADLNEQKQHTVSDFNMINVAFDLPVKNLDKINRFYKNTLTSNYINPFQLPEQQNFSANSNYIEFLNSNNILQILEVQAFGLSKRLKHTGLKSLVIGISGGIDSTLTLLVCERCFDILNYDKKNIYAISMPGLGTSSATKKLAQELAKSLQVTFLEIPITDAVKLHFENIGHNENDKNIVYENSQARQRAMILFNYANKIGGIAVGTGDMSEIALGWSTFNGDHISNYNVNAGVPKTVAKAILQKITTSILENKNNFISKINPTVLIEILENPISPELLPADETGEIQSTEKILGPYELNDFFMFYYLSYFFSKEKLLFVAQFTFQGTYSNILIEECLNIFISRFYSNQYKRSCSVDAPNIYNFSLSPKEGFILPSDL